MLVTTLILIGLISLTIYGLLRAALSALALAAAVGFFAVRGTARFLRWSW